MFMKYYSKRLKPVFNNILNQTTKQVYNNRDKINIISLIIF